MKIWINPDDNILLEKSLKMCCCYVVILANRANGWLE